jgi:molybdopterin/thiamine biosynthesis adenylyltransferase
VGIRLTLAPRLWQSQIRDLVRGGQGGVARVNRNALPGRTEFIARRLDPLPAEASGRDFGSLDELLLVQLSERVDDEGALQRLVAFQPRPGQCVVALVLGLGPAAGRWAAAVCDRRRYFRVDQLSLVGAGMHCVRRAEPDDSTAPLGPVLETPEPGGSRPASAAGSRNRETADQGDSFRQRTSPAGGQPEHAGRFPPDAEQTRGFGRADGRWSRTRGALGDEVWRKVRGMDVGVIGASRNGSIVATIFAMLGVRSLVLVDPDRDQPHGLDAVLGAVPDRVGNPKVLNRREALLRIRPGDLQVRPLVLPFPHPAAERRLREVDLVCTCVDRDAARLAAARFANRWCRLHLDIGSGVFASGGDRLMGADVRLLLPGEACVVCLGGLRDPAEARYESAAPPGALRRGPRRRWDQQRAGSLITINSIACNLGIQQVLDLLAGHLAHSQWRHLEYHPDRGLVETNHTEPAPRCEICGRGV